MKLRIDAKCCVDEETILRNTAMSSAWPDLKGSGHLAVVGGGASIKSNIDVLRNWDGDIWAINGAYWWCRDNGIDAYLYSVDPDPILKNYTKNADKVVLSQQCDPSAFIGRETFCIKGDLPGPTSATAASLGAINCGYTMVTWFGCESCYYETSHAYEDRSPDDLLKIKCNGEEFLTKLDLILQAEHLSRYILAAPHIFKEESGGLLRSMMGGTDFDAIAGSKYIHARMITQ